MLLTAKPILYVLNVDEASVKNGNIHTETVKKAIATEGAEIILICAQIEAEISELESKEERVEYIEMMGLDEAGVDKVIRSCYKLLNLITYFTAGVQEVRAWRRLESKAMLLRDVISHIGSTPFAPRNFSD